MVQGVHAQHALETAGHEGQRLSPCHDEPGLVPEHEAAVARQARSPPAHHFERQVQGNGANADAPEKFRRPARAGSEVQDEIVGPGAEKFARHREVEEIVPALLRGGPVQRKVQARRQLLFFVGQHFRVIRRAADAGNIAVFPGRQFLHGHGVNRRLTGPMRKTEGPLHGVRRDLVGVPRRLTRTSRPPQRADP